MFVPPKNISKLVSYSLVYIVLYFVGTYKRRRDWKSVGNDFHSLFCGDDVLSCQNILPPQRERDLGKSDTASESG